MKKSAKKPPKNLQDKKNALPLHPHLGTTISLNHCTERGFEKAVKKVEKTFAQLKNLTYLCSPLRSVFDLGFGI